MVFAWGHCVPDRGVWYRQERDVLFLLWLPFLETTGTRWLRYPVCAGALRQGSCALSYLSPSSIASMTGTEAAQSGVQRHWVSKESVSCDKEWGQSCPQPAAGRAGRPLWMWPCCQSRASPAPASQPCVLTSTGALEFGRDFLSNIWTVWPRME